MVATTNQKRIVGVSKARLMAVAGAALAPLAVWLLLEVGFGFSVQAPAMGEFPEPMDLGVLHVVVPGLLGGLAGWGLLAILERLTSRAGRVWVAIALLVLLGSLVTPLSGTGIDGAQRSVLIIMHLLVGAILIPMFYRTSVGARE